MGKTALIFGGSGLVGSALLRNLLRDDDYERVVAIVRTPLNIPNPKLLQHEVDFDKMENYLPLFRVDDVFCCLGTTIRAAKTRQAFKKVDYEYPVKIAELSKRAGVHKLLIVTALGADPNSRIFYNRTKGEAEEELKKIGMPVLAIFRPSLLLGKRKEFRLGEAIGGLLMSIGSAVMVGVLKKYKAIPAQKVADAMFHVAQADLDNGTYIYESDAIWNKK